VALDSAPGRGTTVTVWLPRATTSDGLVGRPAATVAASAAPERPATVLVVEDEGAVRHWVARLLAYHGYRVLEARHGADALLVLERERGLVDLVLADVVMPELDGWELAERLRARGSGPPVVLMTGYPFGQPPGAARGVLPLLEKPLDSATVLDVVARSLRAVRAETARSAEPPMRADAPPPRGDADRPPPAPRPPHTDP
jgi:CheY-like chemotaxis protein